MIKIFSFEPNYFNNNGDQGNIEVLASLLKSQGVRYAQAKSITEADFVLIGDASLAVMKHFDKQLGALRKQIAKRFESGRPTLLVGSAYEFFARDLGVEKKSRERYSGFIKTPEGYFGYQNSDLDLPAVLARGAFIATNLFGPVLAKNPRLLERVASELGADAKLPEQVEKWIEKIRSR